MKIWAFKKCQTWFLFIKGGETFHKSQTLNKVKTFLKLGVCLGFCFILINKSWITWSQISHKNCWILDLGRWINFAVFLHGMGNSRRSLSGTDAIKMHCFLWLLTDYPTSTHPCLRFLTCHHLGGGGKWNSSLITPSSIFYSNAVASADTWCFTYPQFHCTIKGYAIWQQED